MSSSNDTFLNCVLPLFFVGGFAVMCIFVGAMYANKCTREAWQTECVQRGAAHWIVDETGRTAFEWNEPEPTP